MFVVPFFVSAQVDSFQNSISSEPEVIYVHDTVYIHDTIYIPLDFFTTAATDSTDDYVDCQEVEYEGMGDSTEVEEWLEIDGQQVIIKDATSRRGVLIRIFDDKGLLVIEKHIPRSQMTDSFRIILPENRRYFLRLDQGKPYLIDLTAQTVKGIF